MKTTLVIDDSVVARLRLEAAKQRRTLSELVEAALRLYFEKKPLRADRAPLPSFSGGRALVDVADREALYSVMEEEGCSRSTPTSSSTRRMKTARNTSGARGSSKSGAKERCPGS